MMTVWETEADVVRCQEKRWSSADRKREWASLAEHGFVQCFPLSQLSQQPCTMLAGCRSVLWKKQEVEGQGCQIRG